MRLVSRSSICIVAGVALGLLSAMQALNALGLKSVEGNSAWKEWRLSAADRLAPYALGHFLSGGHVPTPVASFHFVRSVDDDGSSLNGNCDYVIAGPPVPSRWWSISVAMDGQVSPQEVLSAGRAIVDGDGQLRVAVSRHPSPGNWLQPAAGAHYEINYVVSEPAKGVDITLPIVKKSGC